MTSSLPVSGWYRYHTCNRLMLSIQEDLDLSRKNDYRPGADRAAAFKIIKAKDMELERLKAVLQRTEDRQ